MADCCHPQPQPSCSSGLFRDLVHALPRHAMRISKPRSTGTSPAASASKPRRTTTTAVMPQRNPSVYHRPAPGPSSSLESALLASTIRQNHRRSRPMSWHPAGQSTPQYIPPSSTPSTTAASINMSALALPPSLNDPSLYGDDTSMLPPAYPLSSDLPISDDSFPSLSGMQDPLSFLPMGQTAWDATVPDLSTTPQPLSDGWTYGMMSMNNDIPSVPAQSYYESVPSSGDMTGPSTPDLLPIQPHEDYEHESALDTKDDNELVGMGLYNQPETTQGVLGKGLKLEETFTPSPDDDKDLEDDDEDASNDEQTDQDPEPQEVEPIKQPAKPSMDLLSQSFLFDDDSFEQHAVPDAQQLFSLNQPCMNYGYGWF